MERTIVIYTALWRRPEITRICFEGIKRIQAFSSFNVKGFAVISEESMIDLCKEYGVNYLMVDNKPLGRKMNLGLKHLMHTDFDYVVQINSDNLLSDRLWRIYEREFEKRTRWFGLRDIWFVDSETERIKYHEFDIGVIGCGKAFRKSFLKKALPKIGGLLWNWNKNQGLDNDVYFRLTSQFYEPKVFYQKDEILAIDIKSKTNIWPFDHYQFTGPIQQRELTNFPELCSMELLQD